MVYKVVECTSAKPLLPVALLICLYWRASRLVSNSAKLARRGALCSAMLLLPYSVYASIHGGLPKWSPEQGPWAAMFSFLAFADILPGLFVGSISRFRTRSDGTKLMC